MQKPLQIYNKIFVVGKFIGSFIVQNKLLILILLVAGFSRFWNIDGYMDFKGDEGRDMRVVSRFLKDFDLMFIGPRTSIGDMYLGPLYYYLISPALLFANFNPVGPAVFVALIGVVSVWLIWFIAREWFGKIAANVSALLYAVSPVVIENSRDSWNPNVMPFFALLMIYSFWRALVYKKYSWFFVAAIAFAFAIQSHYLALLLLPTVGMVGIYFYWEQPSERTKILKSLLLSFVVFAILMSPLFIFDLKHDNQNTNSFLKFFVERQETVSAKPWNALPELWPIWQENVTMRLFGIKDKTIGFLLALAVLMLSVVFFWRKEKKFFTSQFLLNIAWLLFGLFGLALLKQNIFDHYFGFVYPAVFLILGLLIQSVLITKFKYGGLLLIIVLVFLCLINSPLRTFPNNELFRVQQINKKIVEESQGKKFNFGLVADRNYDEGYLYFFELWGSPVTQADPQHVQETITDQLFVVCENPCTPTTSSKAEIAHFGMTRIVNEWEVGGYKLFKLVHLDRNSK